MRLNSLPVLGRGEFGFILVHTSELYSKLNFFESYSKDYVNSDESDYICYFLGDTFLIKV